MLIMGYINMLCMETPIYSHMGAPATITHFASMEVTPTDTQRKATINAPYQLEQDAGKLEDWLEMQPQRLVMLGINVDQYKAAVWVASQFYRPLDSWWLNRRQHASIPNTSESLVIEIRKTSLLPIIRDDAINAMLVLTQGSLSYPRYTTLFNDFLRSSRQPLTDDIHCIRFINGLANFQLHTHVESHSSQGKDYNMPLVELQISRMTSWPTHQIRAVQEAHRPHLTTHEVFDFLRSVLLRV
jgi:hypothetical protein